MIDPNDIALQDYGWTEQLRTARLRADPSGIQDAGTAWQAVLLPGLTTVTINVRYITILTAARYLREMARKASPMDQTLNQYWRRLEAIVAICSVLHHEADQDPPTGIIGRNYADGAANQSDVILDTSLRNPPYAIYRGTLQALGLFDLGEERLFERARELGASWDISTAGDIGAAMVEGYLPDNVKRRTLSEIASAFCLCQLPDSSAEQQELISLLFGLDKTEKPPEFTKTTFGGPGLRIASWRMLLEVVEASPGRDLRGEFLMARILEPDLLTLNLYGPVRKTLRLWRWVAARAFFERGWTQIFNETFSRLKGSPWGISHENLKLDMEGVYPDDQSLENLAKEASDNINNGRWLVERFQGRLPKDHLLLLIAGLLTTSRNDSEDPEIDMGQLNNNGGITTASEQNRYLDSLNAGSSGRDYWADTAMDTLSNHFSIAMRKLRYGNPDSLHVDYENGRWLVPTKALNWRPAPALATSRLDVALGWSKQLGLIEESDGGFRLTALGSTVKSNWDKVYERWQ